MDYFEEESADSQSVEEATGNEGASIELRYHKAVIMIRLKAELTPDSSEQERATKRQKISRN